MAVPALPTTIPFMACPSVASQQWGKVLIQAKVSLHAAAFQCTCSMDTINTNYMTRQSPLTASSPAVSGSVWNFIADYLVSRVKLPASLPTQFVGIPCFKMSQWPHGLNSIIPRLLWVSLCKFSPAHEIV